MINSAKTQITRTAVSAPTRYLVENEPLMGRILHHGAGKATQDYDALSTLGWVWNYDPNVPGIDNPALLRQEWDFVVSNYVLNVLPTADRKICLAEIALAAVNGVAYITVRTNKDRSIRGTGYDDGVLTSRGTFQKGFTEEEFVIMLCGVFENVIPVWSSTGSIMAKAW